MFIESANFISKLFIEECITMYAFQLRNYTKNLLQDVRREKKEDLNKLVFYKWLIYKKVTQIYNLFYNVMFIENSYFTFSSCGSTT